ncbi:hypothetical protein [Marivita hallyeonensis]|uniref:Uncharacterized protein n=1 Tax=Marivita hallyeonensis TaxID=996342 RepID=A0A1M5PCF0_9RHOB|nr:hypothetical protein [Marivita hallyeonensis]SHG99501.1 hypothetical protein SAMN05443551_1245 [Marivita hallyeonensis]
MPDLIKLYIRHCAIGFGIAAGFVAMVLYFNVANLWYLVTHTDVGPLAVFLLWVFNGIVFAGVQFGIAIMMLKPEEASRGGTPSGLESIRVEAAPSRILGISRK